MQSSGGQVPDPHVPMVNFLLHQMIDERKGVFLESGDVRCDIQIRVVPNAYREEIGAR